MSEIILTIEQGDTNCALSATIELKDSSYIIDSRIFPYAYHAMDSVHRRHTGIGLGMDGAPPVLTHYYHVSIREAQELIAAVESVCRSGATRSSPPPPTTRFKGVSILLGDGGRSASGRHDLAEADCVATSLAFALHSGHDDTGLAYKHAHDVLSICDSRNGDADLMQRVEDSINAFALAGFEFEIVMERGSIRDVLTLTETARRDGNVVVFWSGHAYAIRSDGVVMDTFVSFATPTGKVSNKLIMGVLRETPQVQTTRRALGLEYARLHKRTCLAYEHATCEINTSPNRLRRETRDRMSILDWTREWATAFRRKGWN